MGKILGRFLILGQTWKIMRIYTPQEKILIALVPKYCKVQFWTCVLLLHTVQYSYDVRPFLLVNCIDGTCYVTAHNLTAVKRDD